MAAGDLERALDLRAQSDQLWALTADANYEAANGMFGGWTTAVMLKAVVLASEGDPTPVSITVNFVSQIQPGGEVLIETRRVGGGRSVSHWACELRSPHGGVLAAGSAVLAARRATDGNVDVRMPAAPDPATLPVIEAAPGPMGERTTLRPVEGFPPFGRDRTFSLAWVRETSGRPIDHLQLAYLADHRPPRSFFWSDGPRPSATLTLSIWFHATEAELAEVGDDELLSEAFGTRGAQSISEEHLRLWSRGGHLLASSVQADWYR
jgi:acyl-CoA thioesterase